MDLPVEITEAFTDLGFLYYEWTVSGHNWLMTHNSEFCNFFEVQGPRHRGHFSYLEFVSGI